MIKLDEKLVQAAIDFIEKRYPDNEDWKGAAAMYTESGSSLDKGYNLLGS